MRAISHHSCIYNGNLPSDVDHAFTASLIILQGRSYVHYSMLLGTPVVWTRQVRTAATCGAYVYLNPDYYLSMATDELRASILFHEVEHVILRHPFRMKHFHDQGYHSMIGATKVHFNGRLYNEAADYVVNADMAAHKLPVHDTWMQGKFSRDDLVDSVYLQLVKDKEQEPDEPQRGPEPQPGGESEDEGEGEPQPGGEQGGEQPGGQGGEPAEGEGEPGEGAGGEPGDDTGEGSGSGQQGDDESPDADGGQDEHLMPQYEADDEADEQAQAQADQDDIQRRVDDALEEAPDQGKGVGHLSGPVSTSGFIHGDAQASGTDWRTELADEFVKAGRGGDVSWKKIHRRRYATMGVISPTRLGVLERVIWQVDISESVNRPALKKATLEAATALDMLQPTSGCLVLFVNTRVVQAVEVFSGQELLDLPIPSGGGTRMDVALDWLAEQGITADIHLCFTDGEMEPDDMRNMAAADAILVLDRHPRAYDARNLKASGVRTIVASDSLA